MDKSLAVIVMMHDLGDREYKQRCDNLFTSLDQQSVQPDIAILIDTTPKGSTHAESFLLPEGLLFRRLWRPHDTFNKSIALNIGINTATADYIMVTDIDFMFHPDTIEGIKAVMAADKFILSKAHYLPEDADLSRPFDWGKIARSSECHGCKMSPGTIQVTTRDWFLKVGGYDERFDGGLGGMDDDMWMRGRKDGLELVWLHKPRCFHQWHERSELKGKCSKLFSGNPEVVKNE